MIGIIRNCQSRENPGCFFLAQSQSHPSQEFTLQGDKLFHIWFGTCDIKIIFCILYFYKYIYNRILINFCLVPFSKYFFKKTSANCGINLPRYGCDHFRGFRYSFLYLHSPRLLWHLSQTCLRLSC